MCIRRWPLTFIFSSSTSFLLLYQLLSPFSLLFSPIHRLKYISTTKNIFFACYKYLLVSGSPKGTIALSFYLSVCQLNIFFFLPLNCRSHKPSHLSNRLENKKERVSFHYVMTFCSATVMKIIISCCFRKWPKITHHTIWMALWLHLAPFMPLNWFLKLHICFMYFDYNAKLQLGILSVLRNRYFLYVTADASTVTASVRLKNTVNDK